MPSPARETSGGRLAANALSLVATILQWFVERRGPALAIVQSLGVGTVRISPMAAWLIAVYGWRGRPLPC